MSAKQILGEIRDLPQFSFGDSPALADELLSLVLAGTKTATCSAYQEYKNEGAALPIAGERCAVLDGRSCPACVIEIIAVELTPFDRIEPAFADLEGEGDRSLDYWRRTHENFFRGRGIFAPDMLLVCERFCVVEDLTRPEVTR